MEQIAVYGAGAIGAGLATLLVGNSRSVVVLGNSESGLVRCRKTVEDNWNALIEQGYATEHNKCAAMKLLTLTADPAALAGCTFVFEAVKEDVSVKRQVYKTICRFAEENVIIASTTSSLDAEILAELTEKPSQLIIAHPFQPAHLQPLVEVVRHQKTDTAVAERTCALLDSLGRQVVRLERSVPGFLVNRFAQALFREAIYLVEQGVASATDIDRAVKYAVGMRYASIGLLEYFDDVGFELESAIAQNVYPDLCGATTLQKTVLDGLDSGTTGLRAGRGLYDWESKDIPDYQLRKQAPFYKIAGTWNMPT